MDLSAIARPYAKAAFEFAKQHKALALWSEQLKQLAKTIALPEVSQLLSNPAVGDLVVADAVLQAMAKALDKHVVNFVRVIAEARRMSVLPAISDHYEALLLIENQTVEASLKSAFPVSEAELTKIVKALEKRLGKQVKLSCEIDKSLIGGAVIHAGDWVMDGSLRGKLRRLSQELMR